MVLVEIPTIATVKKIVEEEVKKYFGTIQSQVDKLNDRLIDVEHKTRK